MAYDHYRLRSFSLTNIRPYELFSCTIFIPHDILAYDLHQVRSSSFTIICHYEQYTVRTLSPTIFRHTSFFLLAFGIRTISIRSFVRTPLLTDRSLSSPRHVRAPLPRRSLLPRPVAGLPERACSRRSADRRHPARPLALPQPLPLARQQPQLMVSQGRDGRFRVMSGTWLWTGEIRTPGLIGEL